MGGDTSTLIIWVVASAVGLPGFLLCTWRRRGPIHQRSSQQVGTHHVQPLVDDTPGATAPSLLPALAPEVVTFTSSSSPSNKLPSAPKAERVPIQPISGELSETQSHSAAAVPGAGANPHPAMLGSSSRAESTGHTSIQHTVLLDSTMDTTRITSAREGTAMLQAGSDAGSHALSHDGSSSGADEHPGELGLFPKHKKQSRGNASPMGAVLGRDSVGAMSRESSSGLSALIGPSKPPLPGPKAGASGMSAGQFGTGPFHHSSMTPSAGIAARENADMHGSFSRSASQQPPGEMALGGISYASSALSGVLTLPPAHGDRSIHGNRGSSDPHGTASRSPHTSTSGGGTGGWQLVHTSDGELANHVNSLGATVQVDTRPVGAHVGLPATPGSSIVSKSSGAERRLPKSFSAPHHPDSHIQGAPGSDLQASAKAALDAAGKRGPTVLTQSGGVASDVGHPTGVTFSPQPPQKLHNIHVGSVAITSGFTRSQHTGGGTPIQSMQSSSPAATPKLRKQASGTV